MSDETPRDEWLTSASQDPQDAEDAENPQDVEEALRADELEAFLAALARANAADSTPVSDAAPSALGAPQVSVGNLAKMLIEVGEGITPDPSFAADLRGQIERRIREHGGGGNGRVTVLQRGSANWRRLRPLWAALAALVLLTLLLALPPVQAALRRPLCLGSVCIVWDGSPRPTAVSGSPTPTPLPSVLDLAGRTTLAQARAKAKFPVRLPAYPADLGQPDYVFLQDLDGAAVVLVWVDHGRPDQVRLALSELSSGTFVYKFTTSPVAVTSVHGQKALWTTGPYMVEGQDGSYETRRLVTGHALIWTEGAITYRLETSVSLDDAVRIAESLR